MAAASEDSCPRHTPSPGTGTGRCAPAGRVRILFGCVGWPSGVLELASWAKHQQLAEPVIFQLQSGDNRHALEQRFVAELVEFDPHVVGFRVEDGTYEQIRRLIPVVRSHTNAEIVLGGPTATSHPVELLEECDADYIFAGEAERSLNLFLRLAWRRNSKDLQPDIPGLAYRYAGQTYFNTLPRDGYGQSVMDVDTLVCSNTLRCLRSAVRPVTEVELIAANRLDWSLLENFDGQFDALYITAGRGCPGSCTYCAKLHGNEVRSKSAAQLFEEIAAADADVAQGTIKLRRQKLFEHVDDSQLHGKQVAWVQICDEDFLLNRHRAIEFFGLWDKSPLKDRYRLSIRTGPLSMLSRGEVHAELLECIDRVKPMVTLEVESFHGELLMRWNKRHCIREAEIVLDALDGTRQDYTVLQLLTDFDTTPEELLETLRRLILAGYRHRRMRIVGRPFTIPYYDSDTCRLLEYSGRLARNRRWHFTDYGRPQPGWMDPLAAELAAVADVQLQLTLDPQQREDALHGTFEVVLDRVRQQHRAELLDQAQRAMQQIDDARLQPVLL